MSTLFLELCLEKKRILFDLIFCGPTRCSYSSQCVPGRAKALNVTGRGCVAVLTPFATSEAFGFF